MITDIAKNNVISMIHDMKNELLYIKNLDISKEALARIALAWSLLDQAEKKL